MRGRYRRCYAPVSPRGRGEVQPSMTIEAHIRATYGQRRDVGLPETPEARPGLHHPLPTKRDARANPPGGARHPTRRPTTGGRG